MKEPLRALVFLGGVALGTLAIYLIVFDRVIMPYVVDVPKITVPRLEGLPLDQARRQLRQRQLRLAIRDSVYHESLPAGLVVDQLPAERQQVKKGRRVSVDISRGQRLYTVPDITGSSPRDARLKLEGSQLRLGRMAYLSSDRFPEGAVIQQQPRAGTRLPRGGQVDLKISSGPATLPKRVPELRGLSITVIEDTLKKYELALGQISERVDDAVPAGTVLFQSIAPPRRALLGTPIDVVLSVQRAAPDTLVPDAPDLLEE